MENRKYILYCLAITLLVLLGAGLVVLNYSAQDLSLRQNEHRIKFGAVYMTLNNPYYQVIDKEMRTMIEDRGDILLSRNPTLSVKRQEEEIQELIEQGVQLIFINPVAADQIEPGLEIAKRAGVPVIIIDTNVDRDDLVKSTILSDNYMAGVQCAMHLISHAEGGRVALLTHNQAKSAVDRIEGFKAVISKNPSFTVVAQEDCQGQLELAMPAMEKILAEHPEVNVVMALNDPTAMGVMAALKHANRLENTLVYSVDGSAEGKEMIMKGALTASAGQQTRKLCELAVGAAYDVLHGRVVEHTIKLPTVLVTKENVDKMSTIGY